MKELPKEKEEALLMELKKWLDFLVDIFLIEYLLDYIDFLEKTKGEEL